MNLIYGKWLECSVANGERRLFSPVECLAVGAVDIASPRPDFRVSQYQFLIGLLQTTTKIKNWRQWRGLYANPPSADELEEWFEPVAHAFELDGDGPRFMQDQSVSSLDNKPIYELLIDSATGKSLKDNTDHFVKRGQVSGMSPATAAAALFCLQTNAPAGGAGYRTGLRGGGPLTAIVLPAEQPGGQPATLWQKCWLNVMPRPKFLELNGEPEKEGDADRFPWLGKTRLSDKTGGPTYSRDVHPDQMFWAMPRRMWLDFDDTASVCSITQEPSASLVDGFKAVNGGVDYQGSWRHPLSPYSLSKDGTWLPAHPQPGGITYRYWLHTTQNREGHLAVPALDVESLIEKEVEHDLVIWASGYDMDNMKARGWQESVMPVFVVNDREWKAQFIDCVDKLVSASQQVALYLRGSLKDAWFKPKAKVSGDFSFISDTFWSDTEDAFYVHIQKLAESEDKNLETLQAVCASWHKEIAQTALALFDQFAASAGIDQCDPRRVSDAEKQLKKSLYGNKLKVTILNLPKEAKK